MAITAHTTRALLKVRNHGSFFCVECDSAYDTADEAWECEALDLEHEADNPYPSDEEWREFADSYESGWRF